MRYYEELEVDVDASDQDIKRAYYRKVREHPPEKDPDKFKSIREAYETLSDSVARRQYDAMSKHGDKIGDLWERAENEAEQENWAKAIRALKELLVLSPDEAMAKNTLGVMYLHNEQPAKAVKLFEKLVKTESESALIWANYGTAIADQAANNGLDSPGARNELKLARECFQKAHQLEPHNSSPLVSIAQIYTELGDFPQALEYCDRAVGADGKVDFQDFEALFYKCIVLLRSGKPEAVSSMAAKIESIIPDGETDLAKYAAYRFGSIGAELFDLKAFSAAEAFFAVAKRLDSEEEAIRELHNSSRELAALWREWEILENDVVVMDEVKAVVLCYLGQVFDDPVPNESIVFENAQFAIASRINRGLQSAKQIRSKYPHIYKLNPEFWRAIESAGNQSSRQGSRGASRAPASASGGDCFIATAAFGTHHAPVVQEYRRFREVVLRPTRWGRVFIRTYELVGPIAAAAIRPFPSIRRLVAACLSIAVPYVTACRSLKLKGNERRNGVGR